MHPARLGRMLPFGRFQQLARVGVRHRSSMAAMTLALDPMPNFQPSDLDSRESELEAAHAKAVKLQESGDLGRSLKAYRELLSTRRSLNGDMHPQTLYALGHVSACLRDVGQLAEAEALAHEQRTSSANLLGEAHPDTLSASTNLISVLTAAGKHEQAEPLARQLLGNSRKLLGKHHAETLIAQSNLAQVFMARGKHDEAEPLVREDLQASRKLHGTRHSDTLVAISNLASVLLAQKKLGEAEALMRKNLALCREVHGTRHPHTITAIHNLVHLLRKRELPNERLSDEVEPLLAEQSESSARVLGSRHPDTVAATEARASLLVHLGRLREAFVVVSRLHGDTHMWTLSLLSSLTVRLQEEEKAHEAEPFARKLYDATRKALGAENSVVLRSKRLLVQCLRSQGKLEEAAELAPEA